MTFDESKHPRDGDGKFTDGNGGKEISNLPSASRLARNYEEKFGNDDEAYEYGSQEELDALLGEEFKGVKGQAAVDKLLKEKRGHVKGAFHRDDIGDIDLFWGNDHIGLNHIIVRRGKEYARRNSEEKTKHIQDVLRHITETVEKGVFKRQNARGDIEFLHNGDGVAIAPTYHGNKITYLLTAYKNENSKEK